MKKTAQEYVYDAINYMRKPASVEIPLQPITTTDKPLKDYGWEEKDICNLCNHISVDCSKDISHNPFHDLGEEITVEQIVLELDKQLNDENLMDDMAFMMAQLLKLTDMQMGLELVVNAFAIQRAIFESLKRDTVAIDSMEAEFKTLLSRINPIGETLVDADLSVSIIKLKKNDFREVLRKNKSYYDNLIKEGLKGNGKDN